MAIKIEMLRCFVAVARSGNLADAADRLYRTPSAVSMMLKQLEGHLGAPLFVSERKSKLTALGAFVLDQAIAELEHFERSVSAIESFARSESGLVRIAAVPSVAEAMLPQVVRRFLRDYPGVWIDIRDMESSAVFRELERERVDLGVASGTNKPGRYRARSLILRRARHRLPRRSPAGYCRPPGRWPGPNSPAGRLLPTASAVVVADIAHHQLALGLLQE